MYVVFKTLNQYALKTWETVKTVRKVANAYYDHTQFVNKMHWFLISNFRRVLNVVCFLLSNTPASEFYMPTFRNILSVPSS